MTIKPQLRKPLVLAAVLCLTAVIAGCSMIRDLASRPYLFGSPSESPKSGESMTETFFSDIRLGGHSLDGIYRFACYLQERKQHHLALQEFRKILEIDPSHVKALNGMGVSFDLMGEYSLAVQSYLKALQVQPDADFVHNNLGCSYMLQGRKKAAAEAFREAIALNSQERRYWNNLYLAGDTNSRPKRTVPSNSPLDMAAPLPGESPPETRQAQPHPPMPRAGAHKAEPYVFSSGKNENLDPDRLPELEVANGNGVDHMAQMVGAYLVNRGYPQPRLANADHFNYDKTVIYYREGSLSMAADVASHIPGWQEMAPMEEFDRSTTGVRVLLGRDLVPYKASFASEGKTDRTSSS